MLDRILNLRATLAGLSNMIDQIYSAKTLIIVLEMAVHLKESPSIIETVSLNPVNNVKRKKTLFLYSYYHFQILMGLVLHQIATNVYKNLSMIYPYKLTQSQSKKKSSDTVLLHLLLNELWSPDPRVQ